MYTNKKQVFAWTSVILWMSLIFYLSHQPATDSKELSSGIMELIMTVFGKVVPDGLPFIDIDLHFLIRKGAHFFAYLVLGVLVMNAIRGTGLVTTKAVIIAFMVSTVYAISDEVHQLYIPGRSGEFRDIMIDSTGALVGIGLYMLISSLLAMKKKRPITAAAKNQ